MVSQCLLLSVPHASVLTFSQCLLLSVPHVALFSWLLCDAQFFAELDQSCMKRDTTEGSCTELELELEHEQHELCCSILNSLHPVSDTHLRVLTYSIFSRSSAALLAGACWHVRAHEEPARAPVAISAPTRDTAQRPA